MRDLPPSFKCRKEMWKSKEGSPFLPPTASHCTPGPTLYSAPSMSPPVLECELPEGRYLGLVTSSSAQHTAGAQTCADKGLGLPQSHNPQRQGPKARLGIPTDHLWPSCSSGVTCYTCPGCLPGSPGQLSCPSLFQPQ